MIVVWLKREERIICSICLCIGYLTDFGHLTFLNHAFVKLVTTVNVRVVDFIKQHSLSIFFLLFYMMYMVGFRKINRKQCHFGE